METMKVIKVFAQPFGKEFYSSDSTYRTLNKNQQTRILARILAFLSLAVVSSSFHVFPVVFISASIVLLQVSHGRPLFLLPLSGVHLNTVHVMLSLSFSDSCAVLSFDRVLCLWSSEASTSYISFSNMETWQSLAVSLGLRCCYFWHHDRSRCGHCHSHWIYNSSDVVTQPLPGHLHSLLPKTSVDQHFPFHLCGLPAFKHSSNIPSTNMHFDFGLRSGLTVRCAVICPAPGWEPSPVYFSDHQFP